MVLESTGPYGTGLAKFFYQLPGWKVSVVNPKQVRRFAEAQLRRSKTDRIDAVVLAQLGPALQPLAWAPLAPEREKLQVLVPRGQQLQRMLQQEQNRLHAFGAAGWEVPEVQACLQRQIANLKQAIGEVRQACLALLQAHPQLGEEVRLLTSIPGIGITTALGLLAEMGQPSRYRYAKSLVAQAGVAPAEKTSGSSVRGKPAISRQGSPALRRLMYMPTVVAICWNPVVRDFYQRLLHKGKPVTVALLAAMNKLLRICWGVLTNQLPFQYQITAPNP